jgi:hypothetical protein
MRSHENVKTIDTYLGKISIIHICFKAMSVIDNKLERKTESEEVRMVML